MGLIASLAISRSTDPSAPISIQHIGGNRAGKFLAHEITEEISTNEALHIAEDTAEGWKLVLLTSEGEGATFYSAVLVRKQFDEVFDQYVFAFNGICTVERLEDCAREIVGKVREPIAQFETDWRDLSGTDAADQSRVEAATGG